MTICGSPVSSAVAKVGKLFVAGVDGCRAGWIAFKVEVPSLTTSVDVAHLREVLGKRPPDLACVGIDIPIGLVEGPRACDQAARKLLGQPRGSSVFPAPCRAAVHAATYEEASGNDSMSTRRWIFIDVDPVRESDPASDEELIAAESKYEAVLLWLSEHGIEPRMTAMSGNGYDIYVPVDGWPNDEEHNNLVKAFIGVLDAKFSDERAKVDAVTANPGRVAKIPGTVSRKGEHSASRPYRISSVLLSNAVATYPTSAIKSVLEAEGWKPQPKQTKKTSGLDPDFDIYDFAEWCGVTVEDEFEKNGCTFYALDECPMAGHRHRGSSDKTCFIVGDSLGFECFSDDCSEYGIGDVLRKFKEENGQYSDPIFAEPDMSG